MAASTTGFRKCLRPWKPRQTSTRTLVRDIAQSIRTNEHHGVQRCAADYTSDPLIIDAVNELLFREVSK